MRGLGPPYAIEADGRVANQVRIKIANRSRADHRYTIRVDGIAGGSVIAPMNPLPVAAGHTETASLFVMLPPQAFRDGERRVTFVIGDGAGFVYTVRYKLVGPERDDDHRGREHTP